jgi:hypothetical protein
VALDYFYAQQVKNGPLKNMVITIGPYKFQLAERSPFDLLRDALAQTLPGPAAGGWIVVIGQNPDASTSMPNVVCMAFVTAADSANAERWGGISAKFEPQKKVRFTSRAQAVNALGESGWHFNEYQGLWFASSGCEINLAKIPEAPRPIPAAPRPPSAAPNLATVMKGSEMEGVRQKIRPCWGTQSGAKSEPIVTLVVQMNPDRTVAKVEVQDKIRYSKDPTFRAAADAAYRAVTNSRCQPWPLSPDSYNSWRTLTLSFDSRDF